MFGYPRHEPRRPQLVKGKIYNARLRKPKFAGAGALNSHPVHDLESSLSPEDFCYWQIASHDRVKLAEASRTRVQYPPERRNLGAADFTTRNERRKIEQRQKPKPRERDWQRTRRDCQRCKVHKTRTPYDAQQ